MKRILFAVLYLSSVLAASSVAVADAKSGAKSPAKPAVERVKPAKHAQGMVVQSATPEFFVVKPNADFALPPIVMQFDPATATGYDWEKLDKLPLYPLLSTNPNVVYPVRYLREAVQRMTGRELPVVSGNDLTRGIVFTTLAGAPADLKRDPEVQQALRSNGKDAYNANEAYFIRSEPQRLVIVTNTVQGFPVAVADLLESVGYEVLGMGPNWTHVPDFTGKPLSFTLKRAGRANGFYIRQLGAASGQPGGIGTLFQQPLNDPADEPVEVSYYQRWLVGTRMAGQSMPHFLGHALQNYHKAVIKRIRETGNTTGLLPRVHLGPEAQRPPASTENAGHLWINSDTEGQPAGLFYFSDGTVWASAVNNQNPGGALDLSVPYVREILLEDMKQKALAHFEKSPDELFLFGTDPEDGTGYENMGRRLHNRNWYPEYLAQEGEKFGRPYVLHGFKGLNQPHEMWDPDAPADTVFGFNNWLLREFDQWINTLPAAQQVTKTGKPIKELVRASLYSYNYHDVPANFNLDPRIRVMIAGYPKHRGMGKWKNYATSIDIAQAYQKQLPKEPSGDYWILSFARYSDDTTAILGHTSKQPATLHRQVQELYKSGFRAVSGEMDFNFGRLGLAYYLYTRLLWNPAMSVEELNVLRTRWLQRAFGSGWQEMSNYYAFMAPESNVINAPNKWGKAIRMIDAADAKIDAAKEPAAQRRLDDLKQFWYFYYLLESGQGRSDSPAMREFLWKGQMSYMTAMYAVAGNIFKTEDVRAAVGPEFNSGPAHYTPAETQGWWSKILDFWQVIPVAEFTDATLTNGRPAKSVDINDLVMVREFQSEKPNDKYFSFSSQENKSSVLTMARQPGEEIGFRLSWPYDPTQKRYSAMDVEYGIARWNPTTKNWEDLVDILMTRKPSKLVTSKIAGREDTQLQEVEVRYAAPAAGTYRIDIGHAGHLAKLGSLAFDAATDSYNGIRPFSFAMLDVGFTQSPLFFYIPKGTKSLDFELWGREYAKTLQLHTGLPGSGLKRSRQIEVSKIGTHRIALNPGEDGSIASLGGNMFNVPRLYSVPQLWAKSPDALLVPRAVAAADGLTAVPAPQGK